MTVQRGPLNVRNQRVPSQPYRRIAAAVVANAVEDLKLRGERRKLAAEWLLSKRGARWMCLLGFEPEAIREGLRRKGQL